MEHSCSPLRLLADVACCVRQMVVCIQEPLSGKSMTVTEAELGVVDGAAMGLLMLSSGMEFVKPGGFVSRKEENLINSVDFEASGSSESRKRKLIYDFEAENQRIKKHRKSLNQSVLTSKPNLGGPFKTKILASGSKLKFYKVSQSCLNSSSIVNSTMGGFLMDFLENQSSWKGKRKRLPRRRILRSQTTSEAVVKSSEKNRETGHEGPGTPSPRDHKKAGHETELPVELKIKIQELGGSKVKLVIQKQLHASDVNSNNSRFSIPEKRIHKEFLEEDEKCLLDKRAVNGQKLSGLEVLLLDPCLRQFNLKLKKWRMNKNIIYNLTHEWNNVRISNGLEEKDSVQLWCFRRHGQLCFALVKL